MKKKNEKEERREERRKTHTHTHTHTHTVKSKPFQTVTKRYWCLFCVVIDMSVQLAETLTWMPEKLKTVHEIVHKHTNFKFVLYFAGWFSKISQIKQLAQCMVSSRFLRRVSLQNWNFHPNTPHTHIFVIFFKQTKLWLPFELMKLNNVRQYVKKSMKDMKKKY